MTDSSKVVSTFGDNATGSDLAFQKRRMLEAAHVDEIRSTKAAIHADEISLVRSRLASSASGKFSQAAQHIVNSPDRPLSDADYTDFREKVAHGVRLAAQDKVLAEAEEQFRSQIQVRDVDPYGEGSPHSWLNDYLAAADTSGDHRPMEPNYDERLQRHSRIVAGHVDKRTAYGQAMERAYCGEHRQVSAYEYERVAVKRVNEWRGLVTGGGASASASGGGAAAFVTPIFLWDAFAVYRSPQRVFADQLNKSYTLPPWGMNAYVPAWSGGGTTVTTNTEDAALSETDPISGFQSGAITQQTGKVTLSRAVSDRVGPGMSGDRAVFLQLADTLGSAVNIYALNQAMPSSQTVTNSGSFSVTNLGGGGVGTGLFRDLKTAKNLTHDTLGTRIRSTHLFTTGDLLDFVTGFADANGQPMFHPSHSDNPPARTNANPDGDGWSGFIIAGLAAYADDSVPTTTTSNFAQLIVTRPSEIALLESDPVFSVYPQALAGNLEDIVVAREYTATIARYPSAVATIGGAAYQASQFV